MITFIMSKNRSKATIVSKSMNSDSGIFNTSSMGRFVFGSKYCTQSYPTYPIAPPIKGGNANPGTCATRLCASSFSSNGNGSTSGPWPFPVFSTFFGPAPTKLYLPTFSVFALSNKKEKSDFEWFEILRYAPDGVRTSDDICA